MTDGDLVIRCDRLQRGGLPFFQGLSGMGKTLHRVYPVRQCQVTPGERKPRFDTCCLLKPLNRDSDSVRR